MLQFLSQHVHFVPAELELFGQEEFPEPVATDDVYGHFFAFGTQRESIIGLVVQEVFGTELFHHVGNGRRAGLELNFIDSTIALNAAFFVNAAILVLAATVFFYQGRTDVAEIKVAHELLHQMLGSELSPILFAVALIAAGQSSTVTGTQVYIGASSTGVVSVSGAGTSWVNNEIIIGNLLRERHSYRHWDNNTLMYEFMFTSMGGSGLRLVYRDYDGAMNNYEFHSCIQY